MHQCLFCPQIFDSASDKDDHLLKHFIRETCTECNQNLIQIGRCLYVQHNEATCIKRVATPVKNGDLCTKIDLVQVSDSMECRNVATTLIDVEICNTYQIKSEPVDGHEDKDILVDTNELFSSKFHSKNQQHK